MTPLHEMENAIQLAGFHYITCWKTPTGSFNSEIEVDGMVYEFNGIRRASDQTLHWEFQMWAARTVLRDLLESFSIFLSKVYEAISQDSQELSCSAKKFERSGIDEQLDIIRKNFNIDDRWLAMLQGFNKARNCLAHRQGEVGERDVDKNQELVVTWIKTSLQTQNDRSKSVVSQNHLDGLLKFNTLSGNLPPDLEVSTTRVEKRIPKGSMLNFRPDEILQISLSFTTLAHVFARLSLSSASETSG